MTNEKTIFRTRVTTEFTTLPNALLRDKRLSFKARGMLAMILSNRDDWQVHQSWLEEQGTEGREAVRSAFCELEASGYATHTVRRGAGGVFEACVWTFHDSPVPVDKRTCRTGWTWAPEDGKPCDGKPSDGKPSDGNPSPKKEHTKEETSEERPSEETVGEAKAITVASQAAQVYAAYPRKVGRPAALKAITKAIRAVGFEKLLAATVTYSQARRGQDNSFTPHPATWFNQERYNDDPREWAPKGKGVIKTVPLPPKERPAVIDIKAAAENLRANRRPVFENI